MDNKNVAQIQTDEIWNNCNKENRTLLNDYIIELKSKKRKMTTISQYITDGKYIMSYIYLFKDNRSILTFDKKDFRDFALWLQVDRCVSNARFNRIFAELYGMLDFAEDDEAYDYEKNYARKIKKLPREPKREIVFLTDDQISKLRGYLIDNEMYRELCYLDICYDSASRINEVAQIEKDSAINSSFSNIVIAKRGKKKNIIFNKRSRESIKLYLDNRGNDNINSLWVSKNKINGMPYKIKKQTLHDMIKHMSKILSELEGHNIDFSSHDLRHSALQNYKTGTHYMCRVLATPRVFSLEELQKLAGHNNISTTMGYLKQTDMEILQDMFDL